MKQARIEKKGAQLAFTEEKEEILNELWDDLQITEYLLKEGQLKNVVCLFIGTMSEERRSKPPFRKVYQVIGSFVLSMNGTRTALNTECLLGKKADGGME